MAHSNGDVRHNALPSVREVNYDHSQRADLSVEVTLGMNDRLVTFGIQPQSGKVPAAPEAHQATSYLRRELLQARTSAARGGVEVPTVCWRPTTNRRCGLREEYSGRGASSTHFGRY
jgi:hypothetical protein